MLISAFMLKECLIISSYEMISLGKWWISLIGLAAAATAMFGGLLIMEKRLKGRSYNS